MTGSTAHRMRLDTAATRGLTDRLTGDHTGNRGALHPTAGGCGMVGPLRGRKRDPGPHYLIERSLVKTLGNVRCLVFGGR